MKINTTNWRKFRVDKLFDVESSPGFDMVNIDISDVMDDEYKYEFIIRSKDNYGVKGYVKHLGIEPNKKNKITISQVGTIVAQYRDSDYYTSQNVFNLEPKFDLTENKALFFVNIFNCMLRKYIGYSDYPTKESLKKEVILLPAIDPDTPDFDYMEKYIEEMKFKYIDKLEKDNDLNIDKALEVTGLSYEDLDKDLIVEPADRYEEFRVGDLFDSIGKTAVIDPASKREYKDEVHSIPALSSTIVNNSFGYYANPKEHNIIDRVCLSVTANGINTGTLFLQNKSFVIAQDAYVIYLKDGFVDNVGVYLYLKTMIEKITRQKYDYTNKAGWTKVQDELITLPAIDKETPDFDYMEKAIYIYIYCKKD